MTEPKLSDLPPDAREELLQDIRETLLLEAAEQIGLPNVAAAVKKIADLRAHILNASDLEHEDVYVPGWDCTIRVQALTAKERAQFLKQVTAQQPGQMGPQGVTINWDRYFADLVILSARDPEDGALLFSATDRDALLGKAGKNLEVVAAVARRLSGLEDDATATAKSTPESE